eukprot:s63_g8.t1
MEMQQAVDQEFSLNYKLLQLYILEDGDDPDAADDIEPEDEQEPGSDKELDGEPLSESEEMETVQNEYASQLLELLGKETTTDPPELTVVNQDKKPKAKAACKKAAHDDRGPAKAAVKNPADDDDEPTEAAVKTRAGDDHDPVEPKQTVAESRKRKNDLPAKHAEDDEKKKARMEASQAKADEMVKIIRKSGIMDLQPPLGFTSKFHGCSTINVMSYYR